MPIIATADVTWVNPLSVQLNAQELRRADAALMGGDGSAFGVRGGIVRHGDTSLAVTVSGSDALTVQAGPVVVPANNGVGNGAYRTALGAAASVNLDARNATNPRLDRVVFQVLDTDVLASTAGFIGQVQVTTGNPAATPVLPDLPTMAIELARLTVPAQGGGAVQVDSSFRTYFAAPGARLVVPTAARLPAAAATRDRAVALDTGREYVWDGSTWAAVQQTQAAARAIGNVTNASGYVTVPMGLPFAPVSVQVNCSNSSYRPSVDYNNTTATSARVYFRAVSNGAVVTGTDIGDLQWTATG